MGSLRSGESVYEVYNKAHKGEHERRIYQAYKTSVRPPPHMLCLVLLAGKIKHFNM